MHLLPVVIKIHIKGAVSQMCFFLYRALFLLYDLKRETFCNCFLDIYSSFHKI